LSNQIPWQVAIASLLWNASVKSEPLRQNIKKIFRKAFAYGFLAFY